jgi:hypothetical protein
MSRPRTLSDEERLIRRRTYYKTNFEAQKYQARLFAHDDETRPNREDAAYDPLRDPPLQHRDLTAQLCGDPPIGRSALDKR